MVVVVLVEVEVLVVVEVLVEVLVVVEVLVEVLVVVVVVGALGHHLGSPAVNVSRLSSAVMRAQTCSLTAATKSLARLALGSSTSMTDLRKYGGSCPAVGAFAG